MEQVKSSLSFGKCTGILSFLVKGVKKLLLANSTVSIFVKGREIVFKFLFVEFSIWLDDFHGFHREIFDFAFLKLAVLVSIHFEKEFFTDLGELFSGYGHP